MFIKVTFKNDVMYIDVAHIEMFKHRMHYTQIWLSNGYTVAVDESPEEILKLIEKAKEAR